MPAPTSIPMPRPEYNGEDVASRVPPANEFIPDNDVCAWLEHLSGSIVRDAVRQATEQIRAITPLPGVELLRRSKYPTPSTVKFATLGRKPTPGLIDVGGLPVELLVSQLVTTFIPAQYGNLIVMDKSTISPGVSAEVTIIFQSLPMPPVTQPFKHRPVDHPMNNRRAPTICINSNVDSADIFYYGFNRPEQTGEQISHGFRTTAWARHLLCHEATDPRSFTPGAEVASLNATSNNAAVTTHADSSYPFCDPSTRDNTTLDFYHVLLTGKTSFPKAQVFTALTMQEPGDFLRDARTDLPLGHVVVAVYRSWAFTQRDTIEEFVSDDGVKYWYHRRTGMTFWERPLYEEEKEDPLAGGTTLDLDHREEPLTEHRGAEGVNRRYLQGEFRKRMLTHHETPDEARMRRKQAVSTAAYARETGVLPPVDPVLLQQHRERVEESRQAAVTAAAQLIAPVVPQRPRSGSSEGTHYSNESNVVNQHLSRRSLHSPARQLQLRGELEVSGSREKVHAAKLTDESDGPENFASGNLGSGTNQVTSNTNASGLNPDFLSNITQSITQLFSSLSTQSVPPQDLVQLGLGMGMALMQSQQGLVSMGTTSNSTFPGGEAGARTQRLGSSSPGPARGDERFAGFGTGTLQLNTTLEEDEYGSRSQDGDGMSSQAGSQDPFDERNGLGTAEPIGKVNPTIDRSVRTKLNHAEEVRAMDQVRELESQPLTSLQIANDLKVVPTETPDIRFSHKGGYELEPALNAEESAREEVKLVVYPELYSLPENNEDVPRNYNTHAAAGVNKTFVLEKDASEVPFVAGSRTLRRISQALPVGFYNSIKAKHVAKQEVDYLPQVPNLPQTRTVGRVKPRSAAIDWLAIGFDPWSAGKSPLNADFISSLESKAEKMYGVARARAEMDAMKLTTEDDLVRVEDEEGLSDMRIESAEQQQIADEFKRMCSLARNGKFREVEEMMNQPDWNVPIDYQDDLGNAIIHICAQNGNKRMIKLCLRRGADVNIQNVNGQTALHFAFAYGYEKLGEYMIRKGADDSLKNKDGLTCYEGLSSQELNLL